MQSKKLWTKHLATFVKLKTKNKVEGDIHTRILPSIHRSCLLSFDNEKISTYL